VVDGDAIALAKPLSQPRHRIAEEGVFRVRFSMTDVGRVDLDADRLSDAVD
jgi:hypothetical protein